MCWLFAAQLYDLVAAVRSKPTMIALRCSVLFLLLGLINAICILNCDNRNECTYSTDEENDDSTVCRCMTNGDNIKIVDRLRKTSLKIVKMFIW